MLKQEIHVRIKYRPKEVTILIILRIELLIEGPKSSSRDLEESFDTVTIRKID
jgi:hypothetical protein